MAANYIEWKLVSLNEIRIESIQNEDIIELCRVWEIRPVESISHIHFINTTIYVCLTSILFFFWKRCLLYNLVYINGVQEQVVSLVNHKSQMLLFFRWVWEDLSIKNFYLIWFQVSLNFCLKLDIGRTLNITISIIFLTVDKIEIRSVIVAIPDCLITNLREEILAFSFEYVMLNTIREDNLIRIIRDLSHQFLSILLIKDTSQVFSFFQIILDFKNIYHFSTKPLLARNITFELLVHITILSSFAIIKLGVKQYV